jgi:hypothetical protein
MSAFWRWLGSADAMRIFSAMTFLCAVIGFIGGGNVNLATYGIALACYFRLLAAEAA